MVDPRDTMSSPPSSPTISNPDPKEPTLASDMLARVYAHNQAYELKQAQEKTMRDQDIEKNNQFFERLKKLLSEKHQMEELLSLLLAEVMKLGFTKVADALNQTQNQHGQSPLQSAFQNQDFSLAKQLMDLGAKVGPEERAAFEVALDSQAARDYGFTKEDLPEDQLHTVKRYGLVLGIKMTSQDGTSSQLAHIGPPYQLMTDSVKDYARANPDDKDFQKISEAMDFSNKAADFSYSTSQRNPEAGDEIAKRIQQGKITSIPTNCQGHAMGISIVPDDPPSKSGHLVFTNRGVGAKPGAVGTQIYKVDDLSNVNSAFINSMMNGHANGTSHAEIMGEIHKVTGNQPPVQTITQEKQKCDNCTVANTRANFEGVLLTLEAKRKGGFGNLTESDHDAVNERYKKFTTAMRADLVNELARNIIKYPNDPDYKKLAREYISQHADKKRYLGEPLEKALGIGRDQAVAMAAARKQGEMKIRLPAASEPRAPCALTTAPSDDRDKENTMKRAPT